MVQDASATAIFRDFLEPDHHPSIHHEANRLKHATIERDPTERPASLAAATNYQSGG